MPQRKQTSARIYRGTPRNLTLLARSLRAGELVAVPTETVYGLAANALDAQACRKIFRAKGRPLYDPLIVHLYSWRQLSAVCEPNVAALKLARRFWPGPLTMVLPRRAIVPAIVSAGQASLAVRVPSHPLFRRLLKLAAIPLAAPSANRFGYVSPTTAGHVHDGLGKKIKHILDGGPSRIGLESTIVDLRDPTRPEILRPGAITREAIEKALGKPVRERGKKPASDHDQGIGEIAPGLLARHYSPRTRVVLHEEIPRERDTREAYVYLRRPAGANPPNVFWLDARGSLNGVARRLFSTLRELDTRGFRKIHVELAPNQGIGVAINDRLKRAAAR